MVGILFILLLLVPVAELYVIVQVGQSIGFLETIFVLIGISILGSWLLKREGTATWNRLQESMRRGQVPSKEATDGALILFGGALLLTPGFLTDIVGLIFVFPVTRAMVKNGFRKLLGAWALKRMGPAGYVAGRVYDAKMTQRRTNAGTGPGATGPTIDVTGTGTTGPTIDVDATSSTTPSAPSKHLPSASDDSPDKG